MHQVKDLTELTVKDLWQEVKDEEGWWKEINERVQGMVKLFLERSLEEELLEFLQASRYVRTEARQGYRNGYYERSLFSQYDLPPKARSLSSTIHPLLTKHPRLPDAGSLFLEGMPQQFNV